MTSAIEGRAGWLLLSDAALLLQCDVHRVRGSGPGGQHRNKTDSAVRLLHKPSGILVTAEERRSQHENREQALSRLRAALAFDWREAFAGEGAPPALAQLTSAPLASLGKKSMAQASYLLGMGELLDALAAHGAELGPTAKRLGLSSNVISKLLFHDPRATRAAAQLRQQAGLRPLRSER